MPWELTAVLVVLACAFLPLVLLYARRRWLTGKGGLFDCAMLMREDLPGGGWALGMARYSNEDLEWYRSFSLSMRPKKRFRRGVTIYEKRRAPEGLEVFTLYENSNVVMVRDSLTGERSSIAMAQDSALGLMSWLESAPPGTRYPSSPA
ncbi:DUF2550 domain-containing protein [Tessaracoccus caeni]|uniref:DUF2550 domain-containing protein n=1 Tax=Tessaracoccus caeni TaxID=3031239 RepID=UPI0023DBB1EA|nr:DUF2550 domain-containing protein [Tessaracoccus caeni]MDF1490113.1 DUF2550 domain-containing protein [Tessaracoccus caeni]